MKEEIELKLAMMRQARTKNKSCSCGLKPKHHELSHSWICDICGNKHTENICPKEAKKNA